MDHEQCVYDPQQCDHLQQQGAKEILFVVRLAPLKGTKALVSFVREKTSQRVPDEEEEGGDEKNWTMTSSRPRGGWRSDRRRSRPSVVPCRAAPSVSHQDTLRVPSTAPVFFIL
jgi:hypothetical protein